VESVTSGCPGPTPHEWGSKLKALAGSEQEPTKEEDGMPASQDSSDPEAFVRQAYATAERMDLQGWKACFTEDGVFIDNSIGVTYQGPDNLDYPVRQYGTAFADMHRELYQVWTVGDTVIVRLALQGTHTGPLEMPFGTLPPTGNRMDAPCADIFELEGGKIKRFDCYPEGSVILTQLGVIGNLQAALEH
jgi:ketosteroid isomerase-like protein